jgi:hypothetical protein
MGMIRTGIVKFFVPRTEPDPAAEFDDEMLLERIAAEVARPVPPADRRIYSIEFRSHRDAGAATVGRSLDSTVSKQVGPKRDGKYREHTRSSTAIVLAIFPGQSHLVVLDRRGGEWDNPVLASVQHDRDVTYFDAAEWPPDGGGRIVCASAQVT